VGFVGNVGATPIAYLRTIIGDLCICHCRFSSIATHTPITSVHYEYNIKAHLYNIAYKNIL